MFNLTGKTALVTGATGGIGRATAKILHKAGAHLVVTGRRQDALDALSNELGERIKTLTCDLTSKEEVSALFDKAEDLAGQIDILVCNAGVTKDNLALRMKDEDWESVIDVNLTSTFILNRAAFKKMMKRKWGRIINIASVVGVMGNPGQANYVASKAGMIGMSKALAAEAATRNITINCVAPGFIETAMTEILTPEQKQRTLSGIPMGRMGNPEEIAASIAFLASQEASYITGQTLHVNGGMLMV